MTSRSGWFAPRIEREHLKTLFSGWRLRAWIELNSDADYKTGVVRMTENEMVLAWDASKGSVGRWLADLVDAGYLYTERLGTSARAGRKIRIASAEEWGNRWGKDGVTSGVMDGVINPSNDADNQGSLGVMDGVIVGAIVGQSLGSVEKKKEVKETSSPSEKRDKNAGTRTRKGTRRCPADWQPEPAEIALAAQLGVDCDWQAGKMRDHTFATPRTDWDATFRNWLREAAERGQARSNGNGKHATAPEHDAGEVQRAHQAQAEQAQEEFDRQREAWRGEVVSAWDRAPPLDKQRIRMLAEQGFEDLRGNDVRFERAVRWRCLELLGDEIGKPKPTRKHA